MVPCSDTQGTKRPRDDDGREEEITIHPDTVRLGKWVKRQRRLYITKKLQPERLEALKEIEFDLKPGAATKEERLEVQLGLLDALRKRRELSKAQVQDLDQLAEEWKRRATEPVYGQRGQGGGNKFDLKWAHHFEQLKQFQVSSSILNYIFSPFWSLRMCIYPCFIRLRMATHVYLSFTCRLPRSVRLIHL